MDVAFKVYNFAIYENTVKIRGVWLNQAFVETYMIDFNRVTLKLKKDQLSDWLILNPQDSELPCIRNGTWFEIAPKT
jgi:hypothetical protein